MTDAEQTPQAEQPPETQDAPPVSPAAPIPADADERERRTRTAVQLTPPLTPPETAVQPEAAADPFTLGQWHDFVRYRCKFCKWDTGHEGLAWQHYAERHGPGADSDEEE